MSLPPDGIVTAAGNPGRFNSIAIDSLGNPHIAYRREVGSALEYAFWDGAVWVIEGVSFAPDVGNHASLALDSFDVPHISFYDNTDDELLYAIRTGVNTWVQEIVDTDGFVGEYSTIVIDDSNIPHIGYVGVNSILYTSKVGGAWLPNKEVVEVLNGRYSSLALDQNDAYRSHASYVDVSTDELKYAKRTGVNTWALETVDTGADFINSRIDIDSNGVPHILYFDSDNKDLKYADRIGGSWNVQTIDSNGANFPFLGFSLDQFDFSQITYQSDLLELKYTNNDGGAFPPNIQTLDDTADVGRFSSVFIDGLTAHIAYYDDTNDTLKYLSMPITDNTPVASPPISGPTIKENLNMINIGLNRSASLPIFMSLNATFGRMAFQESASDSILDHTDAAIKRLAEQFQFDVL